jgi:hypothetical protein
MHIKHHDNFIITWNKSYIVVIHVCTVQNMLSLKHVLILIFFKSILITIAYYYLLLLFIYYYLFFIKIKLRGKIIIFTLTISDFYKNVCIFFNLNFALIFDITKNTRKSNV